MLFDQRGDGAFLSDQLSLNNATNLVIDLSGVNRVGSIMLELLVDLWKHIKAAAGKFVICSATAFGQEVLHITKLDTLWTIVPPREEALALVPSSRRLKPDTVDRVVTNPCLPGVGGRQNLMAEHAHWLTRMDWG